MANRLWLGSVATAALAFMLPWNADPYILPKLLALALVALALLLRPSEMASTLAGPILIGLGCWTVAALNSRDIWYSIVGTWLNPFDAFVAVALYAALVIGVARLGPEPEEAAEAFAWVGIPVCLYAIWQYLFPAVDPLRPVAGALDRSISTQGGPVYLGAVLAMLAVVGAALARWGRRIGWVTLALALAGVWASGTRGALLGALAGAAVYLPLRGRLVAGAAGILLLAAHPRAISVVSDVARLEIWKSAIAIWSDSPWVGTGPGTFPMVFRQYITPAFVAAHGSATVSQGHAHNEILQVLATSGLVGLAGWVLVAAALWRESRYSRVLRALCVAYAVLAIFNPVPHSATAMLAVFAGVASSRWAPAPIPWPHVAAAALSLFLSARMAAADWHYAKGHRTKDAFDRAAAYSRAAELNPWEVHYLGRQLDAIVALMRQVAPEDRTKLAQVCLEFAAQGAELHPNDSFAHEMVGRQIMVAAALGMPSDFAAAMRHYRRAQELAPTWPGVMVRRRSLAMVIGDKSERRRAENDLARIDRLTRRI